MKFRFSVNPIDDDWTGFELGDIEIQSSTIKISSRDKRPSQSMMIFVSLSHLLDGLRGLATGTKKAFKFVGVDSSFSIDFKVETDSKLSIKHDGSIETIELLPFCKELLEATKAFYKSSIGHLRKKDSAITDLEASLKDMEGLISSFKKLRNADRR